MTATGVGAGVGGVETRAETRRGLGASRSCGGSIDGGSDATGAAAGRCGARALFRSGTAEARAGFRFGGAEPGAIEAVFDEDTSPLGDFGAATAPLEEIFGETLGAGLEGAPDDDFGVLTLPALDGLDALGGLAPDTLFGGTPRPFPSRRSAMACLQRPADCGSPRSRASRRRNAPPKSSTASRAV